MVEKNKKVGEQAEKPSATSPKKRCHYSALHNDYLTTVFGLGQLGIRCDYSFTTPVLEPETYGMMIAGLSALAALRRSKASAKS